MFASFSLSLSLTQCSRFNMLTLFSCLKQIEHSKGKAQMSSALNLATEAVKLNGSIYFLLLFYPAMLATLCLSLSADSGPLSIVHVDVCAWARRGRKAVSDTFNFPHAASVS